MVGLGLALVAYFRNLSKEDMKIFGVFYRVQAGQHMLVDHLLRLGTDSSKICYTTGFSRQNHYPRPKILRYSYWRIILSAS